MPPPRVTFSPQDGHPGYGCAIEGLLWKRKQHQCKRVCILENSLSHFGVLKNGQRAKKELGSMRKGHPLSSEANGHPGPLRRWAARPPTLRGHLQGRNPDRPRPTLPVGASEARCPLTGGLEKPGATSNLPRGDSVKNCSGTFSQTINSQKQIGSFLKLF